MLVHAKTDISSKLLSAISENVSGLERGEANSVTFEIQGISTDKEAIYLQEIGEKNGRYNTKNYLFDIDLNLIINIDSDCVCL